MFKFKGISNTDMQVIIEEEEHFIARASQRYEVTEIEGKDGAIYEELGYSTVERPIYVQCLSIDKIDEILAWLNGEGEFEYKGRKTTARFYSELEPQRNSCIRIIDTTFIRDPFWTKANEKYLLVKDRKDKIFSGENIDLSDSAEMRLQGLEIGGNSKQKEITDNLIDNVWKQGGINDITGVEQESTNTIRSDFIKVYSNHLYSISRSIFNRYMAYRFYDKDKNFLGNQLSEEMLTSDKSDGRMNINENSMTFTILNNNVRYMRIIDASNNLNTKYILTTEARKPNYPSEIESCGDNVNLFDKDNVNFINAYLSANKTINATTIVKTYYIECKSNTIYTISKKIGNYLRVATSSKIPAINDTVSQIEVNDNNNNITIKTDSNAKYLLFNCRNSQIDTLTEQEILDSIKIEVGSTPTPYSKFEQGNISFEMCNKNKLDFSKWNTITASHGIVEQLEKGIKLTATSNDCYTDTFAFKFSDAVNKNKIEKLGVVAKPNAQYTFSVKVNDESINKAIYIFFADKNFNNIDIKSSNAGTLTAIAPKNCKYITVRVGVVNKGDSLIFSDFQLEESEPTTYEPHKSQKYTIPTQKPFRKIDTYKDTFIRKNEKWYERHFVERYIFKGTEGFTMMSDSNETFSRFTIRKYDMKNSSAFMCSHFKVIKQSELTAEESISIRDISKDNVISIMILKSRLSNVSAEGFKNWLSNQYNADTPVYIDYVLSEPEDIECTAEQCEILDKIDNEAKTYKNITHIYSADNVSPILEGTYFTPTEEKIENKGNIESRPILRLEKTVSEAVEMTINDVRFKYNFNDDEYVEIDCDEKIIEYEGLNRNRNIEIEYKFPKLKIGNNDIKMHEGDCKIKILRKDRWL